MMVRKCYVCEHEKEKKHQSKSEREEKKKERERGTGVCGQSFWLHVWGCHRGRRYNERRRKGLPVMGDDLITLTRTRTKAVSVGSGSRWEHGVIPSYRDLPVDISVTGTAPLPAHVYDVIEDFMLWR